MTLTELRYVVALAREKHFGKAAAACFVSQPTLSVAIKKLEQELEITLFERSMQDVHLTAMGEKVAVQAQRVLGEVALIKDIVQRDTDSAGGTLQLGIIYSVAPYLLSRLMPYLIKQNDGLSLIVQENYTHKLLERVKQGSLDAAIVALPIADAGLEVMALYQEEFYVALAKKHHLAQNKTIDADLLSSDALLVLGAGHCFRDQVLQANPQVQLLKIEHDGLHKTFEGTSLETLRYMAASGIGITVLPALATLNNDVDDGLQYLPFSPPSPNRNVVLVWRKNYSREAACHALAKMIRRCGIGEVHGVTL